MPLDPEPPQAERARKLGLTAVRAAALIACHAQVVKELRRRKTSIARSMTGVLLAQTPPRQS